ncbi:MAG: hypothetical protein R3C61_12095 [Bacteroidia bacterium]
MGGSSEIKRPVWKGAKTRQPTDLAKGQVRALIRQTVESAGLRHLLMQSLQDRKIR